jgi:hypothetical protein
MNTPLKLFTSLLFVSLLVIIGLYGSKLRPANASTICDAEQTMFESSKWNFPLDMRRTTNNMIMSGVMSGVANTLGGKPDALGGCLVTLSGQNETLGKIAAAHAGTCQPTEQSFCDGYVNTLDDPTVITYKNDSLSPYQFSSGSLLGVATKLDNTTYEPLPVNMAFFWNRNTEKIPFMGTALASAHEPYSGHFLEITYNMWVLFRNAAYGIMALIMIVVGIMIMTRRKISPQASVTLQYAIPRVVIALILITFSYPLGAAIASFAFALRFSPEAIIASIAANSGLSTNFFQEAVSVAGLGMGINILILLAIGIGAGGLGLLPILLTLIGAIVVLFLWLLVTLKIIIIYLKMLMMIISAPITFAMGAVPGKDDATVNWFKKMGIHTISIFAMAVIIQLTRIFAAALMVELSGSWAGFGVSIILGPLILVFVYVFGFNQARTIPEKIDAAIMGPKKR